MRALRLAGLLLATAASAQSIPMIPGFPTNSGAVVNNLCQEGTTLTAIFINSVLSAQVYSAEPMANTVFQVDAIRYTYGAAGTSDGGTEPMNFRISDGTLVCECSTPCEADAGNYGIRVTCAGSCGFAATAPMTYQWTTLGSCDAPPTIVGNLIVEGHCLDAGSVTWDAGFDAGAPQFGNVLSFAPAGGAGMGDGVECSGTPVTIPDGGSINFTRASSAVCTKRGDGMRTVGIYNGDLVSLGNDVARVEKQTDGTLALRSEKASYNWISYSNDITQALSWTPACTSGPCFQTANYATAPDGTFTASRFQYPACSSAGTTAAMFSEYGSGNNGGAAVSMYVKGNGTSGTITIALNRTFDVPIAAQCDYNPLTWTRCNVGGVYNTFGPNLRIGCINDSSSGAMDTGAGDVLLWGGMVELGPFITSPIITTGARAARAVERNSLVTDTNPFETDGTFSISAWVQTNAENCVICGIPTAISLNAPNNPFEAYSHIDQTNDSPNRYRCTQTAGYYVYYSDYSPAVAANEGNLFKVSCYNDYFYLSGAWGPYTLSPVSTAGAYAGAAGSTYVQLGQSKRAGNYPGDPAYSEPTNFLISRVCVSNSDTECQP